MKYIIAAFVLILTALCSETASARDEFMFIGKTADGTETSTNLVLTVPAGEELKVSTYVFGSAWTLQQGNQSSNTLDNTFTIQYKRDGFTISGNTNKYPRLPQKIRARR